MGTVGKSEFRDVERVFDVERGFDGAWQGVMIGSERDGQR